jgi:hypothetical protein
MTTKGAIVIARNNGKLDYVKQAVFLALRIKKYLGIPTSIITDSADYLKNTYDTSIFDQIIKVNYVDPRNNRAFFDGSLSHKTASFKNDIRDSVYELSPYDETLLLDSDYVICNDLLANCFSSANDLMMFKDSYDLSNHRNQIEFKYISEFSVDFYWATVVFFRKTEENKLFFELVSHIKQEWNHYRRVYQIGSSLFRNDFAFSIAIHIMNGFSKGSFVAPLPSKHYYTIDKDILCKINDNQLVFLVEKEKYLGEYTLVKTTGQNIHVMNKFSLERLINEEIANG